VISPLICFFGSRDIGVGGGVLLSWPEIDVFIARG